MTRYMGHADAIEIDDDEGRFQLIVTDTNGERLRFDIHGVAFEFAQSDGLLGLIEWAAQGIAVRDEVHRDSRSFSCAHDRHELCAERLCQCDCHALALDDPKHPTYGERMREAADALEREGR